MKEQFIPIESIDIEENKRKIPGTGLVLGKFYPPHLGHSYLIEEAMKRSPNGLAVIVVDRENQNISGQLRGQWIRENHPVFVRVIQDKYPEWDSELWARLAVEWLRYIPEFVFTSEEYGERWAKKMGSSHVLIDMDRQHVPVSGTNVRENPEQFLSFLKPNVRAYYEERLLQGEDI